MAQDDGPKMTLLGKLVVLAIIGGCFYGAWYLLGQSKYAPNLPTVNMPSMPRIGKAPVEIGFVYGTEKERWIKWAVEEFQKTPDAAHIQIKLIPKGSQEGAQLFLKGEDTSATLWCPASTTYLDTFRQEWQLKYNKEPILKQSLLAISPVVFVSWKTRRDAFVQRYKEVNFATIRQALTEPSGWSGIANKPEWGLFKFGHANPIQSNSGLAALICMLHEYHQQSQALELRHVLDPGFQNAMTGTERGVSGLLNSTGTMMNDMILRGPASYDMLFAYENTVIDYIQNAQGRWGELYVDYPRYNLWCDNPCCIIDAPWSTPAQRDAAEVFMNFLLSEPIQQQALVHGFRPGNVAVPINGADSPFIRYANNGLKIDITQAVPAPKAEVIQNLLQSWQRSVGK